jgi:iron complex outermembrane receptor protein
MKRQLTGFTGIIALLCCAGAIAQDAVLEEITVTAERREQTLQEVPMSVTAFTGDMVEQSGITAMEEVAIQTPNFKMTAFNITEPQLFLRGIGTTNDSIGADPAVAVFIDEVYIGRPSGTSTDLFDLERIEVLRGPQGTLYGRNAAGGAVNIFTRKPQREFESKVGLTVGSDSLVNLRGYANGPISDTVAGKITVNFRQRDGYAENITTGQELEDDDTVSVRGQLLITPSDTVDILLGFDYTDIDTSGNNRFLTNFDIQPFPIPDIWLEPALAANAEFGNDPRKSSHDETQVSKKELSGLLARVDADLDWATLTSITAYRQSESAWLQALVPVLSNEDGGFGLFEVDNSAEQEADQFSQEFRLSGSSDNLNWVAGLYYFKEEADKSERFVTYWDTIAPPPTFLTSPGDVSFIQSGETKSMAVFGQFTWDMTEQFALTLGARYTDDEKELSNVAVTNIPPTPFGLVGIPLIFAPYETSGSESWDEVTMRATVDWKFTDDHMVYVTYSEGFKSGAFNGTQSQPLLAAVPIQPELATNFEIGARTEWLDGRARFNITYFDLEYDDLQTWALSPTFELVADNASAEVSGIETEFAVVFTENFSLSGSFATMDAEFVEGANAGNAMPRAPDQTWSLTADVSIPYESGAALDLRAIASYTDEFHFELDNDPRGLEGDVTVLNASATYTSASERWDLVFWGKNLTDELYSVHHIDGSLGGATRIYAPPRTYGVSLNMYWN